MLDHLFPSRAPLDELQFLEGFRRLKTFSERAEHNLKRQFDRLVFEAMPLKSHSNGFIQRILSRIKETGLIQYELYKGRAERLKYCGEFLQDQENLFFPAFLLRNEAEGVNLKFDLHSREYGLLVHALFIERDNELQGNFFAMRRTIVREAWQTILEPSGAAALAGRAMFSLNSTIRKPCAPVCDWRNEIHYMGLDVNLHPIYVTGIMKFYLRMGFMPLGILEDAKHDEVALFSNAILKRIEAHDPKAVSESKKYTSEGRNDWMQTTKKRESLLTPEELEHRKRNSYEAIRKFNNLP
jgi:hypothetical protein